MVRLVDIAKVSDLVAGLQASRRSWAFRNNAVDFGERFVQGVGERVAQHPRAVAVGGGGLDFVSILKAGKVLVEMLLDRVHQVFVVVS